MITIQRIDREHKADVNIPNQPFPLFGKLLPSYSGGKWTYETIRFNEKNCRETCFPDENYDYERLSSDCVFLGAYDENTCVGLAILREGTFKYMYLYDLKVNADYRGQGVGAMLIESAKKIAREKGYRGVWTQGQDNNLGACLFYLKNGFTIGGLDTDVYKGTAQEGKSDVIFYLDC